MIHTRQTINLHLQIILCYSQFQEVDYQRSLFERYDLDADDHISEEELLMLLMKIAMDKVWQYRLWSFQDTKLERFGEVSKNVKIGLSKSIFYFNFFLH